MRYLLDGYNLMHALVMGPQPGNPSLERARLRFLDYLAVELTSTAGDHTCVFDSKSQRPQPEQSHRGVGVRFSHGQTADDLIEQLIRSEPAPDQLTVVSNDHRLQQAARRRGCPSWTCEKYIDWLEERKSKANERPTPAAIEKPSETSGAEIDEWLRRFGE